MEQKGSELHFVFLPYFTPSHIIPLVDIGRLFAARGVDVAIITTPRNALIFQASVDRDIAAGSKITVHTLNFPSEEVNLPEGVENFGAITSPEMSSKVFEAIVKLREPMERLIRDLRPDCIVSDMFFPWTVDVADELRIPRLFFNPSNCFYRCASHSLKLYAPHEKSQSETETFVIPDLPDKIEMTRAQLPDHVKSKTRYGELMDVIRESELRSYGVLVNSFYELEPAYFDHFRKVMGRKCWGLGPLSHFSGREEGNTAGTSVTEQPSCLNWLDTQKPNSVLYVCFGSMVRFPESQLIEIAMALEASGGPFVWVVRGSKRERREPRREETWSARRFEERMAEGRQGMIVRDWAPQVLILGHPAIGGFMTHCGWNSVLEGVAAGVPLITWPLFADQFYIERLIARVLGNGVEVGSETCNPGFAITGPVVGRHKIEKAIARVMGVSAEAEQIRRQAKHLGAMAKKAVGKGGSSHDNLTALIEEIKEKVSGG